MTEAEERLLKAIEDAVDAAIDAAMDGRSIEAEKRRLSGAFAEFLEA